VVVVVAPETETEEGLVEEDEFHEERMVGDGEDKVYCGQIEKLIRKEKIPGSF